MSNVLYITSGSKLSIANNQFIIKKEEQNVTVSVEEVSSIIIENLQCSITAGVNVLANTNNIPIIYCDNTHNPVGIATGFNNYYQQPKRLKQQMNWNDTRKKELFLEIIKVKTENQLELLKHLNRSESIIENITQKIETIDIENFEYMEAVIAKLYFQELFGKDFIRFEDDEINQSLNYGYAILRGIIKQYLSAKGLQPSLGLWHKSQFNNFNLADDIIEVYRPMVDFITYHFIVKDDQFTKEERMVLQNVMFQKVRINNSKIDYIESVNQYINQIIGYMNYESDNLSIPRTDSDIYEY